MDFNLVVIILLFLIAIVISYLVGIKVASLRRDKYWESEIPNYRKDAIMRSRAVLSGQFSEQLAPFLPGFDFNPNECRFIGKPVDFLVFKGMDEKKIDEVVFVEVKSENSKLNHIQKKIKKAIQDKKVKWKEYKIPEKLTKREEN